MNPETPTPQPAPQPQPPVSPTPAPAPIAAPQPPINPVPVVAQPSLSTPVQETPAAEATIRQGLTLQPISNEADILRERQENTPPPPAPVAPPIVTVQPIPSENTALPPPTALVFDADLAPGAEVKEVKKRPTIIKWLVIGAVGLLLTLIAPLITSLILRVIPITSAGAWQVIIYLSWLLTAIPGMIVLKKFSITYAYVISLAAIVLANALYGLLSSLLNIQQIFFSVWNWSYLGVYLSSEPFRYMLLILGLGGAASILLLAWMTNVIGKQWPTRLKTGLLIGLIVLPTVISAIGPVTKAIATMFDKPINQTALLKGYDDNNSLDHEIGDGWPVLPVATPGSFDAARIETCMDAGYVYKATKGCTIVCIQKLSDDSRCLALDFSSGPYDEARMLLYKYNSSEQTCDVQTMNAILTGGYSRRSPFEDNPSCSELKTPKEKVVYKEQTEATYSNSNLYYFVREKSIVILKTSTYGPELELGESEAIEKTLLDFTDKFEVIKK